MAACSLPACQPAACCGRGSGRPHCHEGSRTLPSLTRGGRCQWHTYILIHLGSRLGQSGAGGGWGGNDLIISYLSYLRTQVLDNKTPSGLAPSPLQARVDPVGSPPRFCLWTRLSRGVLARGSTRCPQCSRGRRLEVHSGSEHRQVRALVESHKPTTQLQQPPPSGEKPSVPLLFACNVPSKHANRCRTTP